MSDELYCKITRECLIRRNAPSELLKEICNPYMAYCPHYEEEKAKQRVDDGVIRILKTGR